MRQVRQLILAAAFVGLTASYGLAQPTGGTPGGTAGGAPAGTTAGTTGTGSTGGQVGSGFGQPQLVQQQAPPPITGVSLYSTGTGAALTGGMDASNVLGATYANPLYQGRAGAAYGQVPGGFANPLYTITGATGGAGGGPGGAGGIGGAGGLGAFSRGGGAGGILGGAGTTGNQTGVVVQMPRAIAYPAQLRFAAPAVVPARLQTDLRGILNATPMIANAGAVQIQVEGSNVLLRGSVRDAEEARLVEGLVRLTPGVRQIKNELTFPAQ
jgi:hypothetical protein